MHLRVAIGHKFAVDSFFDKTCRCFVCRKYLLPWKFFTKSQMIYFMLKIYFLCHWGVLIRSHSFLLEICQKLLPFLDIFNKKKNTNHCASSFNKLLIFSWHIPYLLAFVFSLQPRNLGWEGRARCSNSWKRAEKSTIMWFPLWSFLAEWSWIPAARKRLSDLIGAPEKFYTWCKRCQKESTEYPASPMGTAYS